MPLYSPLSEEFQTPDPDIFLQKVKCLHPTACGLRAVYDCSNNNNYNSSPLKVQTPMERAQQFINEHQCESTHCNCANLFIYYKLSYSESECDHIEESTRGQSKTITGIG